MNENFCGQMMILICIHVPFWHLPVPLPIAPPIISSRFLSAFQSSRWERIPIPIFDFPLCAYYSIPKNSGFSVREWHWKVVEIQNLEEAFEFYFHKWKTWTEEFLLEKFSVHFWWVFSREKDCTKEIKCESLGNWSEKGGCVN